MVAKKDKKELCHLYVRFSSRLYTKEMHILHHKNGGIKSKSTATLQKKNSFDVFCTTRMAESNQGKHNTIEKNNLIIFY